jgi:endonuclease/exonuclease/phosphatase (EEP) superfamily protein YafD
MKRAMPGWHFVGRGEILIATKLEIAAEHVESLAPGPDERPLVEAIVRTPAGEVSVIAVHLVPTLPFDSWAPDRGAAQGGSLVDVAHVRAQQVERVRAYAADVHRPVVVCGDFNTPPTTPPIRALSATLDDAFALRGSGFGYTAPTRLPQQRIDYVFVRGVSVARVTVGDATTSDHHPVIADLVIARAGEAR